MIVEAATLISIFTQIREWLGMVDAKQNKDNAENKASLRQIYTAAFETKAYIAARRDGNAPRDSAVERRLSRLWSDAAVELRLMDRDLAERCLLKAEYWSDPSQWTNEQVAEARIGLDTVIEESRQLL